MNNFNFFSVPRIIFGRGQFSTTGEIAAQLGKDALIVFNGSEVLAGHLSAILHASAINSQTFRQHGEPKVADVDAALNLARREECDLVIGLGGGSAIDCAKAVAGLLTNGGDALDYMEVVGKGQKISKPAAPWIAIPTTAGTGAEVTRNAVIGAPAQKFKASIRGEQLLARIALVDPELSVETPPRVTAASGMDALCQCIESYTSTGAQPMTDALALQGIRLAARSLKRAFDQGTDLEAREDMALAALLSGVTLTNAGLGAVHGFAAPLGANYPVPHGVVCASLLPHVIRANIDAARSASMQHPLLARYAAVGRALTNEIMPVSEAIDGAFNFCAALSTALQIPALGAYGLTEAGIDAMVDLAKKASSMRFNPIPLPDIVLGEILRSSI